MATKKASATQSEPTEQMHRPYAKEPIAVIGMECIFPKAPNKKRYWQNILNKVNTIGDPMPGWEAEHYLKSGYVSTSQGGYLKELYRMNPLQFGIMPSAVDGGEPDHFLALEVTKRALLDAGERYLDPDYDHTETGIILGHSTYLHRGQINSGQHFIGIDQTMEILSAALPNMTDEKRQAIRKNLKDQLPPYNADVVPSMTPNVMTGRIANRLNFNGPNYLIDAACASSLLSVGAAVDELRSGNSRMMLAGGVNASLPSEVAVLFTDLGALSKKGMLTPFDKNSDGTLLGEGLGVVVLKRLSDALEDGDRIYSLVHGVGQSSDGKGKSLLAPNEKGEELALKRAYGSTGIDPNSLTLMEAHGTGIPLGDETEIGTLKAIFGDRQTEQGSVALGSVKSMISHCIPAAGIASFIKTSYALYHKILPPTICENINADLRVEESPFYVNTEPRPWVVKDVMPRRAGINSFGFGGVNAHAILEEPPAQAMTPKRATAWSCELCVFVGENIDALFAQLNEVREFVEKRDAVALEDIAFSLFTKAKEASGHYRLALVVENKADLLKKTEQAIKRLSKQIKPLMGRGGIFFTHQPIEGKLAFMFPGEGSQYVSMLSDLAMVFEPVREWFDFWAGLYDEAAGDSRADVVFPVASELNEERRKSLSDKIHTMDVGSEAVFIAGQAMHSLLQSFDIAPDVMVGHSSGESSALVASRAVPWSSKAELKDMVLKINTIYRMIEERGDIERGVLMAVALISRDKLDKHLENSTVVVAMENCPTQTIVYGDKESIDLLSKVIVKEGAVCEILPFDRGYHTKAFTPMKEGFIGYYRDIDLKNPEVPLYSCASADVFPSEKGSVQALAARQWGDKVRFIDTVQAMYADGVRHFIEVGPGGKLTSFAEQILRETKQDKDCLISASNLEKQSGMSQFLSLLGKLFVNQKASVEQLFANRDLELVDFSELTAPKPKDIFLDNSFPRFKATPQLTALLNEAVGSLQPQASVSGAHEFNDAHPDFRPFITGIDHVDNDRFEGTSYLCVDEDNFLKDHALSARMSDVEPEMVGLPCVPLMVTLEIMAEACATIAGRLDLRVIENVQAFNWIALDEGHTTLTVRAKRLGDATFEAEVFNKNMRVMCATYIFGEALQQPQSILPPLSEGLADYQWPNEYQVYDEGMFHGEIFQTVRTVDAWGEDGIDARISPASLEHFFRDGEVPNMVLNPALMDSTNQLTAVWMTNKVGSSFNMFPTRVGRIEFYADSPQNIDGIYNKARRNAHGNVYESGQDSWDIESLDAQGNVLIRVKDLANIFFMVPESFFECRCNPLEGWLGHPLEGSDASRLQWYLPYFEDEFCRKSNGVFLRSLAFWTLSHAEREEWLAIENQIATIRADWLFSRVCIKEAARYWIYQQTGELVYPADIEVNQNEQGDIFLNGWWCEDSSYLIEPPLLSVQVANREVFATVEVNASTLNSRSIA